MSNKKSINNFWENETKIHHLVLNVLSYVIDIMKDLNANSSDRKYKLIGKDGKKYQVTVKVKEVNNER